MFIADWNWTEPDHLPSEAWAIVVYKRDICCVAGQDAEGAAAAGSPLIPLDRLDDALFESGAIRLGLYRERPLFVVESPAAPPGLVPVSFRALLADMDHNLTRATLLAYHLLIWLENSRYCGRCGAVNEFHHHEKARVCPSCGQITFPRISPAVITAVHRENRILLAHNRRFDAPVYSLVAGFVEAGETLEETVAREIREEVGIEVENIRYFASQPWPFPDSLMIGFTADWKSGDIVPDGIEISDAGWFSADDMPRLPGRGSISFRIIENFLKS
jgi:NAD+ diphosphatase